MAAAEEGPVLATDLSDSDLIGKMYAGESGWEDHFATLYGRYLGQLVRYFLVRGLTPEDAEDGAENCFYRVLDTVGSSTSAFNSDLGPFRAWLFTIAHHEWINIIRANSKYAAPTDTDHDEESRDIMADFAALDQPVDVALEKQELVDLLHTCISTLKPKEREIIALRLSEEPYSAIAELLDTTGNYAMVLHCLALGKLKKCFFERLHVRRIYR
jgi:RNA polymerase sigma factor (sigma-70 family)